MPITFIKHFCRLVTEQELEQNDVAEYFDIVQSVVPAKLVVAYTDDGEKVSAEVTVYNGDNETHIYEIVLQEQIDLTDGEQRSDMLAESFDDVNFDFETSLEI